MSTTHKPRDVFKLKRHLRDLCITVEAAVAAIDRELAGPSTHDRGKRLAAICNALEMEKDCAKHVGLGLSLKAKLR